MQSLAVSGYSKEQVAKALHAPNRKLSFKYDLLDSSNQFKRQLTNVLAASVANNALADIKRTAKFTVKDDGGINFLSDRIKPWARLWIPPEKTTEYSFVLPFQAVEIKPVGGYAEWPMGVFILSTPPRNTDANGAVTREVEAYDLLQILTDDKVTDRFTVAEGVNYIVAVKEVLDSTGLKDQNLTPTDKILPTARDWDPGTTKLQIVNDLLGAINYRSLIIDENGFAVALPYVSPADRASEYVYADDDLSIIFPEVEQGLDLFAVPNKWVLVCSEADREPLVSAYTNENPDSLTSTVSRKRTIVDYHDREEAADQASLDAKVLRLSFEASQVYEQVSLDTAIMPMHADSDVFTLRFSALGISAKYSETEWSFDLSAGARMKHRIRRVIKI